MGAIRYWAATVEEGLWKRAELGGLPTHKGLIGELRETQLIQIPSDFLPKNLCVGRGLLIDCRGQTSIQIAYAPSPTPSRRTMALLLKIHRIADESMRQANEGSDTQKAQALSRLQKWEKMTDDECTAMDMKP
jgi:hypothetical protein